MILYGFLVGALGDGGWVWAFLRQGGWHSEPDKYVPATAMARPETTNPFVALVLWLYALHGWKLLLLLLCNLDDAFDGALLTCDEQVPMFAMKCSWRVHDLRAWWLRSIVVRERLGNSDFAQSVPAKTSLQCFHCSKQPRLYHTCTCTRFSALLFLLRNHQNDMATSNNNKPALGYPTNKPDMVLCTSTLNPHLPLRHPGAGASVYAAPNDPTPLVLGPYCNQPMDLYCGHCGYRGLSHIMYVPRAEVHHPQRCKCAVQLHIQRRWLYSLSPVPVSPVPASPVPVSPVPVSPVPFSPHSTRRGTLYWLAGVLSLSLTMLADWGYDVVHCCPQCHHEVGVSRFM